MKVATDRRGSVDPVPAPLRRQRDLDFDRFVGGGLVLTPAIALGVTLSEGSYIGMPPEIPDISNRAVFIATFTASRSLLTASGQAVYTEITFRVSDVFEDPSGHGGPGSDVTVIVPGGTVKTASGEVISFLTQPRQYFVEPGKTYLLVTQYMPEGDYHFTPKTWDLSDGICRANDAWEVGQERQGGAMLIGLTRGQLVNLLRARVAR
jgi:hypothetical protein